MALLNQIDCFSVNMKFWKFLGIHPTRVNNSLYRIYSSLFIFTFVLVYLGLSTVNFIFLPRDIDVFIGDMIFFFTEIASTSKILTFVYMNKSIRKILNKLEEDDFQPKTEKGIQILKTAKNFNVRYWRIVAAVSYTSNFAHTFMPVSAHIFLSMNLELPVCSYAFLSESFIVKYIYPLFFYQAAGIHFFMLININIDTFFLGLMKLVIAQLEILEEKLMNTILGSEYDIEIDQDNGTDNVSSDKVIMKNFKNSVTHYGEVGKFCTLIEHVFSITLFVQFSMASGIICVCLFRFTLPAPVQYYIFLTTYMLVMIIQIMVPCWFGTCIMDKSCLLSQAIYNSDWTRLRSRRFKSNMRLFVERANVPLTITAMKMFPLSLNTFSSIMNSAYSFFTLLQHMKSK